MGENEVGKEGGGGLEEIMMKSALHEPFWWVEERRERKKGRKEEGKELTADEDLDGSFEVWNRERGGAEGEDLARGEGLLGRLGVREDGRVEEAAVEEGSFVAGGVGPGEVAGGQMSESLGLVVPGQFAGPDVEGCAYEGGILGEGCEDEPIAGGRVPDVLSVWDGFI